MMTQAPETERSYDVTDIALFVWRAVMIILATIAAVYGFWTAVTAETAKCAGQAWLAGYRAGVLALWVPPPLIIMAVARTLFHFRRAKITELLSVHRETLFSFGTVRITEGMLLVCGWLVVSLILLGIPTEFLVVRHHAIANYCRADAVSGLSRIWQVATDGVLTEHH